MTRHQGKSPSFRTSIPLWLSVSLVGSLVGALYISAQGWPPNSQGTPTRKEAAGAIVAQQNAEVTGNQDTSQASLPEKRKRELMKANFEKMKHDAGELAELSKSLQEDLDKAGENVLALRVVEKADKIQKLAKKIKSDVGGF